MSDCTRFYPELYDSQVKGALTEFNVSHSKVVVTDRITVRGTCYANDKLVILSCELGNLTVGLIACIVVKEEKSVLLVLRQKNASLDPDHGFLKYKVWGVVLFAKELMSFLITFQSDMTIEVKGSCLYLNTVHHGACKAQIRRTLLSLEEEQVDIVKKKLMDLGVTNLEDLTFLKAVDLDGILPPVQSRHSAQIFNQLDEILNCLYLTHSLTDTHSLTHLFTH